MFRVRARVRVNMCSNFKLGFDVTERPLPKEHL